MQFETTLAQAPLIAILRGLKPDEAIEVAETLYEEGFRLIEVPLNSPDPFTSISRLAKRFGNSALVGAGTVTDLADVSRLADTGARLLVAPNCDPQIISTAKAKGMHAYPGVATPSEAIAALKAGADGLKLFPAETIGLAGLQAWKAVLPSVTPLIPVGGVTVETIPAWARAGATAFGIGSALFKPGMGVPELRRRARAFAMAISQIEKD